MIRFGSMSIVLLCGALYGAMRAAMLCFIPVNRTANRLLAALIGVLALYTAPYIIGYAGYYDAFPWLSFAPYNLSLAAGPLLYLYLRCLLAGGAQLPPRWALHLIPAALQLLYYSAIFIQPLAFKNHWDAAVHVPWIDPPETLALLLSLAGYWLLAWRGARQAPQRRDWTRNLLVASGLTVLFWWTLAGAEWAFSGLTYFQRFPFYLWLALLVAYLGAEGYRQGLQPWSTPLIAPDPVPDPAPAPAPAPIVTAPAAAVSPPDLAELGERWRATIVAKQWWRDPELTLASLARRLGTNTSTLSRALNDGLGVNFNEAINRLRIDAVIAAMQGDADTPVLDLALAEGFNSKASFNRAFKTYTGQTPTEYRRRLAQAGSAA